MSRRNDTKACLVGEMRVGDLRVGKMSPNHPYHHSLNLGHLQPDSLDPDGIIYSSSDLDVSFSITLSKIICVEVTLS